MLDFKAFIYKANTLNFIAIDKLTPLLHRRMPNHMEELSLIDCKMGTTLIEHLMDSLLERSYIRKFALVKVMHSERSFEKVI